MLTGWLGEKRSGLALSQLWQMTEKKVSEPSFLLDINSLVKVTQRAAVSARGECRLSMQRREIIISDLFALASGC